MEQSDSPKGTGKGSGKGSGVPPEFLNNFFIPPKIPPPNTQAGPASQAEPSPKPQVQRKSRTKSLPPPKSPANPSPSTQQTNTWGRTRNPLVQVDKKPPTPFIPPPRPNSPDPTDPPVTLVSKGPLENQRAWTPKDNPLQPRADVEPLRLDVATVEARPPSPSRSVKAGHAAVIGGLGLVVFTAVATSISILQPLNGVGGAEEPARLRAGAQRVVPASDAGGAASDEHDWRGGAAQAYDDRVAALADLQKLMANTDTKAAAALDAHEQQLDATRNVFDAADLKITTCTPMAESLLNIPSVGPALSIKFQLTVAMPLVAGYSTAQQQAHNSSTRTRTEIDTASGTYRYIHNSAARLA